MALDSNKRAMLLHLAAAGDLYALEALAQEATGRAGLISGGTPAAKSATSVHASRRGDAAANLFPGPIGNPATPRNLRMVFGANWDGGDVTAVGTDQFGAAVTEVFADVAGSTVVGTKVFATVTSLTKETVGVDADPANTVTVGTGDKIGLLTVPQAGSPVLLAVDGVGEAVTFDATYNAFTPTTVPNGSHVYVLTANI